MKKTSIYVLILVSLFISFTGCKEIKEKVDDSLKEKFIKNFNVAAEQFKTNSRIEDAYAIKNESTNEVNIIFKVVEMGEDDQFTVDVLSKMIPNLISVVVNEIRTSRNLIEDGHSFVALVNNLEDSTIYTVRIDQQKLNELDEEIKNKTNDLVLCDVPDMLSKVFVTLNSSLPAEDPESGLNLMKIILNEDRKMVYLFEVLPEAEEIIESDALKDIFIATLKQEPSFQNLKGTLIKENISTVQYKFISEEGNPLREIDILFSEI